MIELQQLDPEMVSLIANLFANYRRVDLTLESIFEGQSGSNISITLDSETTPRTVQIRQGSFIMFGGDAGSDTARILLENLAPSCYIMPAADEWISLARRVHGDRLLTTSRYSCSGDHLDFSHLTSLAGGYPDLSQPERINYPLAELMRKDELHRHHFGNFVSIDHFLDIGFGYCIREQGCVLAACTSSLVSTKGVEVSVTTRPDYRRRGAATLAAASFLIHCLENNRYPNWDAGNIKSVSLAQKLGYNYIGSYDVYCLSRS